MSTVIVAFAFVLVFTMTAVQAMAQTKGKAESTEELQKAAQNPVADIISIPLQNNFNFGVGPQDKMQYAGHGELERHHPHHRSSRLPAGNWRLAW